MSLQDLALPIDIPWRLIATSPDMVASHKDRFPHAMWRSSVAVFAYDPDLGDMPEVFLDRELTFLKVVATITSYNPGCPAYPPPPNQADFGEAYGSYYDAYEEWEETVEILQKLHHGTYACSGALLQVAAYPKKVEDETVSTAQLAYFASIEPQKRELLEAVTESGEFVSQSKSNVNVRKGVTSTNTTEDLNVFTGANVELGFGDTKVGAGVTGQWGTVKRGVSEAVNVTNSDASREAREGSSHSTSLSQLYHLLNAYHLGTNRAIFFLQPRPHTVQQKEKFTFINGPQEIEGIQEFFLVLCRPKGIPLDAYCVDALLYTAHLDHEAVRQVVTEPKTAESQWLDIWATAPKDHKDDPSYNWLTFLVPIPLPSLNDPVSLLLGTATTAQAALDEWKQSFKDAFSGQKDGAVTIKTPAIADQLVTSAVLGGLAPADIAPIPGWRIDRTRGLGGYDLWEDPNNYSATPTGQHSDFKPEAFIDIVSHGAFDDPATFLPDCGLRLRAAAWPGDNDAVYHARLKVYFIRDETPASDRPIDMFVTTRGVSTCSESPFYGLYDETTPEGFAVDIAGETRIRPVNVAPWLASNEPVVPSSTTQQADANDPGSKPTNSARPSGLDQAAVSMARTKMVNGIATDVRYQLKSLLSCPQPKLVAFHKTDFVFRKLAERILRRELERLAKAPELSPEHRRLADMAAHHPAAARLMTRHPAAGRAARRQAPQRRASARPALALPALELTDPSLSERDRQLLTRAGVRSVLDLLTIDGDDLAERMGVHAIEAKEVRLRAIGLATFLSARA